MLIRERALAKRTFVSFSEETMDASRHISSRVARTQSVAVDFRQDPDLSRSVLGVAAQSGSRPRPPSPLLLLRSSIRPGN